MIDGFAAWDRFDYRTASSAFADQLVDDVRMFWDGKPSFDACRVQLDACLHRLREILKVLSSEAVSRGVPPPALLDDILANARRRGEIEHRYDDAVARLYRFIEGLAQHALWERHGLTTGKVPVDRLPESFSAKASEARMSGKAQIELGLRDAYRLLSALGDPLGDIAPRLEERGHLANLLQRRNQSLLAHGSQPVLRAHFAALFEACLSLSGRRHGELTEFPNLPEG
jgi:CRISPR-associated protein (TIGR02710 family)